MIIILKIWAVFTSMYLGYLAIADKLFTGFKSTKMKQIILIFIQRWKAESPTLFKVITNISVTLVTVGSVLLSAPVTVAASGVANFTQPHWISFLATHLIVVGVYGGIISKLTVKENSTQTS